MNLKKGYWYPKSVFKNDGTTGWFPDAEGNLWYFTNIARPFLFEKQDDRKGVARAEGEGYYLTKPNSAWWVFRTLEKAWQRVKQDFYKYAK